MAMMLGSMSSSNTTSICGDAIGRDSDESPPKAIFRSDVDTLFHASAAART